MSKESDIIIEEMLFIATLKAMSEQSTMLIGEMKPERQKDFRALVRKADYFIRGWEKSQSIDAQEFIQGVTDVYHNITIEIRKGAKEKYEQQEIEHASV